MNENASCSNLHSSPEFELREKRDAVVIRI